MMQNLRFTIAAGETKRFEIKGRYLEVIEAQAPLTLVLSDPAGGDADRAVGVLSGTYAAVTFAGLSISSATAQTVELFLSDGAGGTRRQPGIVRVVDDITEGIQLVRGDSALTVTAFAAAAIVTPASNTNGIILRHYELIAAAGSGGNIGARLVAAKTAPTGYGVPAQQWPIGSANALTTTQVREANSFINKLLPPGWGVYHVWNINTAAAAVNFYQLAYEPVP